MNPSAAFSTPVTIRFHEADPAGIVFFGNVFPLAHAAYERFIESLGFSWKDWFRNPEWAVPIRHSEADYHRPLLPGETYHVAVKVDRLGDSSATLKYAFLKDSNLHCEVTLVHAFLDLKTKGKCPIPAPVRSALEAYQRQSL